MSNKILITYSQLEASKKRFLQTANEINTLIRVLNSEIQALKPKWQWLASDSFIRHWESKCKNDFLVVQNMCNQFAEKIDTAAKRMKELDSMLSIQMSSDKDIIQGNISNSTLSKPVPLPNENDDSVGSIKPMSQFNICNEIPGELNKPVTLPNIEDEFVGSIKPMDQFNTGNEIPDELNKPVTLPNIEDDLVVSIKPMGKFNIGTEVSDKLNKPVTIPS